jgi:hypothetical protein
MKTKAAKTPPVNDVPLKSSWRDHLKVHPACDLFPLMSQDELKALGEDIKKNGLVGKIKIIDSDGWVLVDGRNRIYAMELVGIRFDDLSSNAVDDGYFDQVFIKDEEVAAYVISANICRRHLTDEQKRELIGCSKPTRPSQVGRSPSRSTQAPPRSARYAATLRSKATCAPWTRGPTPRAAISRFANPRRHREVGYAPRGRR